MLLHCKYFVVDVAGVGDAMRVIYPATTWYSVEGRKAVVSQWSAAMQSCGVVAANMHV